MAAARQHQATLAQVGAAMINLWDNESGSKTVIHIEEAKLADHRLAPLPSRGLNQIEPQTARFLEPSSSTVRASLNVMDS
jgi:hypothetical protein